MRIAEAVCKDFTASAGDRYKRIWIRTRGRNPVAAVLAECILRMQIDIRSDPQDFSQQSIEPLRSSVAGPRSFSLSAIADRNVEIAVIVMSRPGQRVKHHIGDRMITVETDEHRVGKECRSRWSPYH